MHGSRLAQPLLWDTSSRGSSTGIIHDGLAITPGTRLGVYEITALIGEGGMGQVYRARDTTLHRDVALKILPDAFASDPERLARFTREAQTLASLNHPHIAAIYGFEESRGVRVLVMELVEGEDLERENARRAVAALESLEYRPRAPVAFAEFVDPDKRTQWVRDQNLTVFSLYSPRHPLTEVDLFVESPLDFDDAYQHAVRKEVVPGVVATFVGIQDLRRLKQLAGRPQDLIDLEGLSPLGTEQVDE